MNSWREVARAVRESEETRDNRDIRDNRAESGANVPNVPNVPANPARELKLWHSRLSAVDEFTSPVGITLKQWLDLVDDACWIYEEYGSQAIRYGWSALDLFGVRVGYPCTGGLADRLGGARNLLLDRRLAVWSVFGDRRQLSAPCGDGLTLLWELEQ